MAQGVNFHLDGAEVQVVLVEAPGLQTQEDLLEGGEGDPRLLAEEEKEVAVVMDQEVEAVLVEPCSLATLVNGLSPPETGFGLLLVYTLP